jgi:hypothetical protein
MPRPLRRPANTYEPGVRIPMSMRVTQELKATLESRSKRSGRSMLQEIEHLIELGLAFETVLELGRQAIRQEESDN